MHKSIKLFVHFCTVKSITSASNPFIKKILLLQEKSRLRKEENLFIIDGWKETQMAIANGFLIETILFRKGFDVDLSSFNIKDIIEVSEDVFDKISYRGNTSKVVAVAQQKSFSFNDIQQAINPVYLIIDGVEKPGNIGAILRIADAAAVTAIICCDTKTDLYNPNVIRSSVGCFFTKPTIVASKEETLDFMQANKVQVFTTSLKASKNYLECNYRIPAAFVVGTEATGVDAFWEDHSTQNIIIPMRGQNDSLNVSNTVAIILFEALRQRS